MDKVLLKVAGIIAFICGILICLTVIGAIVGIPLIIGGRKCMDLANSSDDEIMSSKDSILIWTIVFLFLCQLAGVFSLIFYVQLEQNMVRSANHNISKNEDLEKELKKLKKLYDDDLLTKEEYEYRKKRLLDS